jgi:hypothetical protein
MSLSLLGVKADFWMPKSIAFLVISKYVATFPSIRMPTPSFLSLTRIFSGCYQSNAATLRQNLEELIFQLPADFEDLESIRDSLRGGNLRRLVLDDIDWCSLRHDSKKQADIVALFSKTDFPCLESLEFPERFWNYELEEEE